jgi:Flp pilus assembly protein TadB
MILVYAAAALAGGSVYWLAAQVKVEPTSARRMGDFLEVDRVSHLDRVGQSLADRLGLSLASWRRKLDWARLSGKYLNWTVGGLIARSLLFGLAALLYVLLFRGGLVIKLGIVAVAAAWPLIRVNSAAGEVKRQVSRVIPEAATVMAAELDVAGSVEQAFERVAEMPGPLGRLLQRVLEESRQSRLPVFSRGSIRGVAGRILAELGLPELTRFGSQLDRIASKGVESARIMHQVAEDFVREYRAQLLRKASSLDNELLIPMALFFFIPFIVALMLPLMLSLFQAF